MSEVNFVNPSLRIAAACQSCRRESSVADKRDKTDLCSAERKVKCGGQRPQCDRCRERGLQCSYDKPKKHAPSGSQGGQDSKKYAIFLMLDRPSLTCHLVDFGTLFYRQTDARTGV